MVKVKAKAAKVTQEVLYPQYEVEKLTGDKPLTVEFCQQALGWEVESDDSDGVKFGDDYLLKDRQGRKVRTTRNPHNRPFYLHTVCEPLVQTILNSGDKLAPEDRQWQFNGEPIIIGEYGNILNGQHTLVAVMLAEQDRTGPEADYWRKFWSGPVTIEKVVTYGVKETDKVVNTMDTCRPRSLADIIYRSSYFAKVTNKLERQSLAKVTADALKYLWKRIGRSQEGVFEQKVLQTHPESLDFLGRHERLLKAVHHIWEEDQPNPNVRDADGKPLHRRRLNRYLTCGKAAALFYLMGCSAADANRYHRTDKPSERRLDFSRWLEAETFWSALAGNSPDFDTVRGALNSLVDPDTGEEETRYDEKRIAIICKAWQQYVRHEEFDLEYLRLKLGEELTLGEDGVEKLTYPPTVGGIDLDTRADQDDEDEPALTPEEIAANKAKVDQERLQNLKNGKKGPRPQRKPQPKPVATEVLDDDEADLSPEEQEAFGLSEEDDV